MEGGYTAELSATYGLPMGRWCVSGIQDFSFLFTGANERTFNSDSLHPTRGSFDEDISAWDVSSATDMTAMFSGAEAFDQDLAGWSTSNVTTMESMFTLTGAFNQNLSAWSTSEVTNMQGMFYGASSFNKDLSLWNVTKVSKFGFMFLDAGSFNQNLCAWGGKLATNAQTFEIFNGMWIGLVNLSGMFKDTACPSEENPNLNPSSPLGPFCQVCN
jgi:surface protein